MRRSLLPRSHPELAGPRDRRGLPAVGACRRRRGRLRLPRARRRQARRRARRRDRPRDRGDGRHGDGEVRLPLAGARALRARRLPRLGERRRRRRDRGGQVHHDDLPRDRCARRGSVVVGCAGHPAPLLVAPDGTVEQARVSGLALGVEPGQTYEEATATVERGGALVVYTDGVIEARRDGEFYGVERLVEVGRRLAAAAGGRDRAHGDGRLPGVRRRPRRRLRARRHQAVRRRMQWL